MRSTKERGYRKVKRAEDEQRTRARIVDAAESMHAEVGPARATISAIAERAGVTRATVYRHFPDADALFLACAGQWLARQELPDPDSWTADDPFVAWWTLGLTDIYRYFRAGEPMLSSVIRDEAVVPSVVRDMRLRREQEWRERLAAPASRAIGGPSSRPPSPTPPASAPGGAVRRGGPLRPRRRGPHAGHDRWCGEWLASHLRAFQVARNSS